MPSTALGERPRRKERWRAPLKTSGTRDSSTSIRAIGTFRAVVLSIMPAVGLVSVDLRARTNAFKIDIVRFVLARSEEHTSELQSLMRISYAVFCLKKHTHTTNIK